MPTQLTGESLRLAEVCPASHALPRAAFDVDAKRHVITHLVRRYVAALGDGAQTDAIAAEAHAAKLPGVALALAALPSRLIGVRSPATIGARYAYDAATSSARVYSGGDVRPTEVLVTADVLFPPTTRDAVAVLVDVGDASAIEPHPYCRGVPRVAVLAACLASLVDSEYIEIISLAVDPDAGTVHGGAKTAAVFNTTDDALALLDIGDRLHRALDKIAVERAMVESLANPDVYPGEHCARCPAVANCPAHTSALGIVAAMNGTAREGPMTPAEAGTLFDIVEQAERLLPQLKAALKDFVRACPDPVVTPRGEEKFCARIESEVIEPEIAEPLLLAEGIDATERTVTKAALERAVRALHPKDRDAQKAAFERVLAELRAAGAIRTTGHIRLSTRKHKAAKEGT